MNYKESSDEEEISLAVRRSLKKQRKSKGAVADADDGAGDVTKMETEDYGDSLSQVNKRLHLYDLIIIKKFKNIELYFWH